MNVSFVSICRLLVVFFVMPLAVEAGGKLPLKGGENVLFVGNSLTAKLDETVNEMAKSNGLPAFNGHRVQIWNDTFRTHVLLSPEKTPEKFAKDQKGIGADLKKLGYQVAGANTLFGQGIYNRPELTGRGYLTALEVIAMGTPEGKPWDVVVLQAYSDAEKEDNKISRGPGGETVAVGPLMEYGKILIEAAQAVGAEPVIYAAWGNNPAITKGADSPFIVQTYTRAAENYLALARHYGISLIPVRSAARELFTTRKPPEVPEAWLHRDNVHGAACGNALLHYLVTAVLYGKSPMDLNFSSSSDKKSDDTKHYVVGEKDRTHGFVLTPEIDKTIKSVADEQLKALSGK